VQKLKRLGVSRYVDFLVTSEAVGREKPNSAMFRAALKRAGCKAHEAIMVGDSARRDVAGAKHMGLKAVLVGRGPKGIADARIFTFRQLTPRLINRLQLPTSKKL
jgi:putative hydrolase of the HAD superfamily